VNGTDALQTALGAEHAAVFVYGVIGGRLADESNPHLAGVIESAYEAHLRRRDRLQEMVAGRGVTPRSAALSYEVPPGRSPNLVAAVARRTEVRTAENYAQVVGSTTGEARRFAIDALTDAALRELDLGGSPSAYPGLAEL
jgi:Domain of unknown function (DUF4439)